jgi:hypothetical protein
MTAHRSLSLFLIVLAAAAASAAEPPTTFDWRSREFATADVLVGCGVAVVGHRADSHVTMMLSVLGREERHQRTELRLSAARRVSGDLLGETALAVLDGWVRTSSASSVGVLARAPESGNEYVATAPGLQSFADLFRGMRKDGAIIGVRLADGERSDRPGPPPRKVADAVIACVNRLVGAP